MRIARYGIVRTMYTATGAAVVVCRTSHGNVARDRHNKRHRSRTTANCIEVKKNVRYHRLSVVLVLVGDTVIRISEYQQMAHGKMSYRPTHGGVMEEKNARVDIKMAGTSPQLCPQWTDNR